ncbi:5083_t:CDS:2 [Diversispora eburnea]|uniref:5083_t:CDS:1 n=1 Tax=Diversispora eburnea TaxID=1213867 RepID=A0A9N8V5F1_9GLOM|nr:5083_t:CDS:2 [Diversispora eburnea]
MKEPFVAIEIIPTTPVLILHSGNVTTTTKHRVTGVLRIELSKSIKVKSISITFSGKCVISFSHETAAQKMRLTKKMEKKTRDKKSGDPPRIRSSMIILNQTISLLEDNNKKWELIKGVNEFPFSFDLPTDVPPSITDYLNGYIRYKLSAMILPASLLGKLSQEKVDYILKIIRPRLMINGLKRYTGMIEEKRIKYELEVPKMIILPMDDMDAKEITINARLIVMREIARIKTVSLEISQISKYLLSTSSNKVIEKTFITYTKPASLIDFTTALPSITQDHHLTLTLPYVLVSELSPDISSHNLEITHNFRITITFMNNSLSPCFLNPAVTVGYVSTNKRLARSVSINESPTQEILNDFYYRRGSEGWILYLVSLVSLVSLL